MPVARFAPPAPLAALAPVWAALPPGNVSPMVPVHADNNRHAETRPVTRAERAASAACLRSIGGRCPGLTAASNFHDEAHGRYSEAAPRTACLEELMRRDRVRLAATDSGIPTREQACGKFSSLVEASAQSCVNARSPRPGFHFPGTRSQHRIAVVRGEREEPLVYPPRQSLCQRVGPGLHRQHRREQSIACSGAATRTWWWSRFDTGSAEPRQRRPWQSHWGQRRQRRRRRQPSARSHLHSWPQSLASPDLIRVPEQRHRPARCRNAGHD